MNYALCVGVNLYQMPGSNLRGCVNDVYNMTALLTKKFDFSVLHVKTLTDSNATKDNILSRLSYMVDHAQDGDHLVFHFSGHGSQVPDLEGDEQEDSLDEILCPHDMNWDGVYIKDDDLHSILVRLHPAATMDVVLDCCHSGTGLREIGDSVQRYIPNPNLPVSRSMEYNPVYMLKGHDLENVALWAGCKSNQTSADACIDGINQGAMTWALIHDLSSFSHGKDRQQVIQNIQADLEYKCYEQTPQLECNEEMRKKRVFE